MDSRDSRIQKSLYGAQKAPVATWARGSSWPGGVPGKALDRLTRMPRPAKPLERLQLNAPVTTPSRIVQDLGLSLKDERSWAAFFDEAVATAGNQIALRRTVIQRMKDRDVDPAIRAAMLRRTLAYARSRELRKSLEVAVQVVDPAELREGSVHQEREATVKGQRFVITEEGLEKAQARGGNYHRRVPRPGGGFRYFYDAGEYGKRPDAHTSGSESREEYMGTKVSGLVEAAGPGGLALGDLKELVKRFGKKELAAHLKSSCASGKLKLKKNRLYKGKS